MTALAGGGGGGGGGGGERGGGHPPQCKDLGASHKAFVTGLVCTCICHKVSYYTQLG